MNKVGIVLRKEWRELRMQRWLVVGLVLPPVLVTLLPVVIAFAIGQSPPDGAADLPPGALNNPALAELTTQEIGQVIIGQQFGTLILLLPLIIPSVIASYSIVGEKNNRTLEPLLATPIHTWELLLGKSLAAMIPVVLLTWVCAAILIGGLGIVAVSPRAFSAIVTPSWLLLLLLFTPLLALITVALMVAISSRVNDPRSAQQLSGVIVVPILGLLFAQLLGVLVLSPAFVATAVAILALIAALSIWAAVRLFQREVILTRWK